MPLAITGLKLKGLKHEAKMQRIFTRATQCYCWYWLRPCVCACHKSEFYRNGLTNRAGFCMGASFQLSCTVLKGNSGIVKTKDAFLWNFVPNSGLEKFRFGISIVEKCYRLSGQGGRSESDKLDRRRSTMLTIPPSSDSRPLNQSIF